MLSPLILSCGGAFSPFGGAAFPSSLWGGAVFDAFSRRVEQHSAPPLERVAFSLSFFWCGGAPFYEKSRERMIVMMNSVATTRSKHTTRIVKERIWTGLVTSRIMKQPLESDTDGQLHKERVISVRKAAEFASRVL